MWSKAANTSKGWSFGKVVYAVVVLGAITVAVLYGKTIGLFLKFFVEELKVEWGKKR